ncbi:MAG TPA: hypothetical protein VHR55_04195 [Candidatus Limnocylindria bacterium]|nr:hypothetical protein [Candidatus Limnocylindria bacterium]
MLPSRPFSPEALRPRATLWMSTPFRIALVVVLAVAALVLALWFIPADTPPIGQGSPSPTATVEEPSPSLEPSLTPEPTPTAPPTPTVVPTPAPLAVWTGLVWSDPMTPSFTVHLVDVIAWGDGYVAVGTVETEAGSAARILTSPDGLSWTVAFDPGADHWPQHIVVLGDEILAFSQRWSPILPAGHVVGAPPDAFIWRSTDGEHWSAPEAWPTWRSEPVAPLPPGWDEAQHPIHLGLVDVAAGPTGVVAIGNAYVDGGLRPVVEFSADGTSWASPTDSMGRDVLLNAIVEHDGRYVVTGAVGVGPDPADATAAAWYSDDGLTWVRATIEPDEVGLTQGSELGPLWAAREGLIACRGSREMAAGGWHYMDGWTSTDGATWRHSPQPGPHPACDWSASDGTRIVSLGPRDHASPMAWPGVTTASVSTDGVTWQPLELSSTLTDRLERFWVVPDGVIYAGEQSFWFGTAVER